MDISKGLILKGTAATTAVATTSTGAYYHEEIIDYFTDDSSDIEDVESSSGPGTGKEQSSDAGGAGNSGHSPQLPEVSDETAKRNSLGLDGCTWPTDVGSSKTCSDLNTDKLKKINFEGKVEGTDLSVSGDTSSAPTLTIEKVSDDGEFPKGYKFIFKTQSENGITVSKDSNNALFTLKKGMDLEFKIKEVGDKWSLERAWNKTTLAEKVNLTCPKDNSTPNECSFKATGTANIFVSKDSKLTAATVAGTGKIKLEEGQKGYNQGLKFTIEEADMVVSGAASTGSGITKLEKYETYEIKEMDEGGKKWYFVRKNSAVQSVNKKIKSLGLPSDCKFDESTNKLSKECDLSASGALNAINFSSIGSGNLTVDGETTNLKLKMERVSVGDRFPSDLKFTFKDFTAETITIKKESGGNNSVTLKKGTDPEFKLNSSNSKLERAWTINELGKKVGLNCQNPASKATTGECSFDGNIKIYEGDSKKVTSATVNEASSKRMLFSINEKDHNQGFKFTVKDADIDLTSGGDITALTKADTSYEIKYQGDDWYLSKKSIAPAQ